ncbi:MAG: hypothetical protein ACOX6N_05200 [Patescibacteria group bacterium]|jgi:hypothetical protein
METIDDICRQLNLNEEQTRQLKSYISNLVIELLESLKQDNIKNFDETIRGLQQETG